MEDKKFRPPQINLLDSDGVLLLFIIVMVIQLKINITNNKASYLQNIV